MASVTVPGSQAKIKQGIKGVASATKPKDAYKKWSDFLTDYFRDVRIGSFAPTSFPDSSLLVNAFTASEGKNFPTDMDKNLLSFVTAIQWNDGKDTKGGNISDPLNFKNFSDSHIKETNVDKYLNDLSSLLHNWFSKVTV